MSEPNITRRREEVMAAYNRATSALDTAVEARPTTPEGWREARAAVDGALERLRAVIAEHAPVGEDAESAAKCVRLAGLAAHWGLTHQWTTCEMAPPWLRLATDHLNAALLWAMAAVDALEAS